ncbi:MAG: AmmeMemoRadiSam system radical SAM enzyme [Bdellovibrionota bacterium]
MVKLKDMAGNTPDTSRLHEARYWHKEPDGRIVCTLCPRDCHIAEGQAGFCYIRQNLGGKLYNLGYGRPSGFAVDPVEKKPLNHFLPGTPILSFGTVGCNLGCRFCQNWDISKAREESERAYDVSPREVVDLAIREKCPSIAFTYNDPTTWLEYTTDIVKEAVPRGIRCVAVTAGFISPESRPEFYENISAANVDLKGFTEEFYGKVTLSHLAPVLDTLKWLKHESKVWFEITNLMIPTLNDSPGETKKMCEWILKELGPDVPIHFTAFHPDYKLVNIPGTPPATLKRARQIAKDVGLHYVYTGNVRDLEGSTTFCPGCGDALVVRDYYRITEMKIRNGACPSCGKKIPGIWPDKPVEQTLVRPRAVG